MTIFFAESLKDLLHRIPHLAKNIGDTGLWIAWRKQASGVASDLNGNDVRRIGLDAGIVDYKIAAIDDTWSGLKFSRRK